MIAGIISFVLYWDPILPQVTPPPPCQIVSYRIYDCIEDLCHSDGCHVAAEVGLGKTTVTLQIDDSVTHVFFVKAVGICGWESWPSNQVSWMPPIQIVQRAFSPPNLRYGPP